MLENINKLFIYTSDNVSAYYTSHYQVIYNSVEVKYLYLVKHIKPRYNL